MKRCSVYLHHIFVDVFSPKLRFFKQMEGVSLKPYDAKLFLGKKVFSSIILKNKKGYKKAKGNINQNICVKSILKMKIRYITYKKKPKIR